MKKLLVATAALLTLSVGGTAGAADLARPVYKAPPPPPPVYNWTGCYVGGGFGYKMLDIRHDVLFVPPAPAFGVAVSEDDAGARGWLGTVQFGCDFQFNGPFGAGWVIGAFVDGDWANVHGNYHGLIAPMDGNLKLSREWAVGGRLGYLVNPGLLAFVSGGWTQARIDDVNFAINLFPVIGFPTGVQLPSHTVNGWFIGGGTEYQLGWFPGLFWKTEYRFAQYRDQTNPFICISAGALCPIAGFPTGVADRSTVFEQSVRTELVWRFNWGGGYGGPLRAAY